MALAIDGAQLQRPAVARDLTSPEPSLHPARKMRCRKRTFLDYTLSAKAAPFRGICFLEQRGYAMKTAAF